MIDKKMKQWDKIFKNYGKVFLKIDPEIRKAIKIFKKHKVKRVLDLGYGSGRHLVYLAKNGFVMYGVDIAKAGIIFGLTGKEGIISYGVN